KPIPHLGVQPTLFRSEEGGEEDRLIQRLRAVGFIGDGAKLVAEHTASVVEAAIAITERKGREGVLKSPGGFLRSILKDGTARQESLARDAQGPRALRSQRAENADEDALMAEWEEHRRQVADEIQVVEALTRDQVIVLVKK